MIIFIIFIFYVNKNIIKGGWGIGDLGMGDGDWAQSPIPNPQSPIPHPPTPFNNIFFNIKNKNYKK